MAYQATTYRLFLPGGVVDLRVDQLNASLESWLQRERVTSWAVLTACNPASQLCSAAENAERQSAMEVRLLELGLEPYAGENIADKEEWPVEESCFVSNITLVKALELAGQFGQNAILFGVAGQAPTLSWVESRK